MIKAILIDDEKNALEVLELQIQKYCKGVQVLALANSGAEGIELINRLQPDLVFLDIEMPHKNGFDVLQETIHQKYKVIFTTAYDQFAIKAFRYAAVDYLLKPIDILELQEAIKKINTEDDGSLKTKLELLLGEIKEKEKFTQRIALHIGESFQFFEPDEILRFESESNYTHIFLLNGKKITLAKTLKEIEETVNGRPFFRVHQSHLINMNHIIKFYRSESSYVILRDNTNISISRNKKESFLESFRRL